MDDLQNSSPQSTQSSVPLASGSSSNQTQIVQPQNQLISIWLNDSNYLIWKQQVIITIRGYGLEGFLTGEFSFPEQYVTNDKLQ